MAKVKICQNSILLLLTVHIILLLTAAPVFAVADYYVDSDENDLDAGTSRAAAFETIQHAIDTASTSNIVNVNVGTYDEAIQEPNLTNDPNTHRYFIRFRRIENVR